MFFAFAPASAIRVSPHNFQRLRHSFGVFMEKAVVRLACLPPEVSVNVLV